MEVNLTAYLLFMTGGAVLCAVLLFFAVRRKDAGGQPAVSKAAAFSALTLGLGIVLGLLGAKLLYFLFRCSYIITQGAGKFFLSLKPEELSYYGGAAGVCLACFLSAKILGLSPGKMLNAFAAPAALMAALARFAEYWLGALGTGNYMEEALPFPFAVSEVWNPDFPEYYLAVFMLEGILSLRIALFAFGVRKERNCFLRTVFYLCLIQILCESLRDQSIRWLFVRYEQLLCYLIAEGILVYLAVRGHRERKRTWGAAAVGLLVAALVILIEFMLDGKITLGEIGLPRIALYGIMTVLLFEMSAAERRAWRRLEA